MPIREDNGNGEFIWWDEPNANAANWRIKHFVKAIEPAEKNDKPLWDKLLYAVKEIYEPEYCCVAGGAIRDYLIGKPPKDIDIFLKLKDGHYNAEQLYDDAQCLGWKNVDVLGDAAKYAHNDDLKLVMRGEAFGYQVEIVFVNKQHTGKQIVDTFDFYINQHWYDGEVNSTPMAKKGIQKKIWTPLQGLKLDATLREHFNRVNKRHGNIYKLDEGEPWYQKFAEKAKIR